MRLLPFGNPALFLRQPAKGSAPSGTQGTCGCLVHRHHRSPAFPPASCIQFDSAPDALALSGPWRPVAREVATPNAAPRLLAMVGAPPCETKVPAGRTRQVVTRAGVEPAMFLMWRIYSPLPLNRQEHPRRMCEIRCGGSAAIGEAGRPSCPSRPGAMQPGGTGCLGVHAVDGRPPVAMCGWPHQPIQEDIW